MPRPQKPARLWPRKDDDTWVILDGGKHFRTGYSLGEREKAEEALRKHLTKRTEIEVSQSAPDRITNGELLAFYADEKGPEQKAPERTVYAIEALASFWGNLTPSDINRQKCKDYALHRNVSDGTVRRELGVLNAAVNHAIREGRLKNAPKATLPKKPEPLDRWLTQDEASLLRQNIPAHLDRFVVLSLFSGRRKKSVLDLRWKRSPYNGWIDLDRKMIHFKGYAVAETSKRRGSITMPDSLFKFVKEWQKDGNESVVHYNGKPVSDVDTSFDRACSRCGFDDVVCHTLKHTAVTWAFQGGMSLEDAEEYFATSHETLLKVYKQHSPSHQRRAVGIMDNVGASFIALNVAEQEILITDST